MKILCSQLPTEYSLVSFLLKQPAHKNKQQKHCLSSISESREEHQNKQTLSFNTVSPSGETGLGCAAF